MKLATATLSGLALRYAVAIAQGGTGLRHDTVATWWITIDGRDRALSPGWAQSFTPDTDGREGMAIIERWKLCLGFRHQLNTLYVPEIDPDVICWARTTAGGHLKHGPTPLIAAMRCFVTFRLGGEIEIPDCLLA